MNGTTQSAQNFAESLAIVNGKLQLSDQDLTKFQNTSRMTELTNIAMNKSFMNCKSILNEYQSGFKNTNLTQEDFIKSVGAANPVMGKYLSGLNGAEASMSGYIKALAGAKLQTIGLQAASMALNAVISMGVAFAIQGLLTLVSKAINYYDDLADKVSEVTAEYKESQDSIQSHSKTISEISDRYKELATGVDTLGNNVSLTSDEFDEYNSICNQIADMYPSLIQGWTEEGNAIIQFNSDDQSVTSTLIVENPL